MWKQLVVCFLKQLKEPFPGYMPLFNSVLQCRYIRGHHYTFFEFLVF